MALYPLSPLISKCHITIWTRRWHDAGPPPYDAESASRQLQQARHVLAQSLYHLNTAHINASVTCVVTLLVHHLQMLAQRRTNDCVEDPLCYLYFDPFPTITDRSVLQIGPQRRFNAGPTLLVRIMNKTLAQHWVNAYNSFHLYINMLFFRLTSRINPSCQTDAVLITANKLKRDDSRAWFW